MKNNLMQLAFSTSRFLLTKSKFGLPTSYRYLFYLFLVNPIAKYFDP